MKTLLLLLKLPGKGQFSNLACMVSGATALTVPGRNAGLVSRVVSVLFD